MEMVIVTKDMKGMLISSIPFINNRTDENCGLADKSLFPLKKAGFLPTVMISL
jgi:hypothetical protein